MDFAMELDTYGDYSGLPPLSPLRDLSSSSSSFFPSQTASSFSRFTGSRMAQSKGEGRPLDLPSAEEQTEERRHASPRGMAAFSLGMGLSGSVGDEMWRVKRRVLREPLIPIEETLNKRLTMQKAMSTPALLGSPTSTPQQNVRRRRRKTPRTAELAQASTSSSWTCDEGSSLVQSCVRLCAAEDAALGFHRHALLPSSPSAAGGIGMTERRNVDTDTMLRQRPLPSNVLTRMKESGWTMSGPGCTVWMQQARQLAASRSAAPAAAGCKAIHERLQLLQLLERHAVPQGVEALRAALKWRCGSLEQAFLCLDVGCRKRQVTLSVLEFAGGLVLLGLDAPALCGFSEAVAFRSLDADGDGRLSILDLLGASAPEVTPPNSETGHSTDANRKDGKNSETGGTDKWMILARFIALHAWFATPVALRRRWRNMPGADDDVPTFPFRRPGVRAGSAMTLVTSVAEGAIGRASERTAIVQQHASDPVRRVWSPSVRDFEELEKHLRAEFIRNSSVQQLNEHLLTKSDLYRLLGDIPPVGIGDDPAALQLTRTNLSDIFDEVMALQTQGPQNSWTKGLTFESFRLLLLKASIFMGLHFRHLVEDAIEARVQNLSGGN